MPIPLGLAALGGVLKSAAAPLATKAGLTTLGINALAFLPMLGGPKGAGTRAAAKNAISNITAKGSLNNLAKQLGIENSKGKTAKELREEILDELVKQEYRTDTRLGTIAGTGRSSTFARGAGYTLGGFGAFEALTGPGGVAGKGNPSIDELLMLTAPDMQDQLGIMEQDIARLNMAEDVGQALTNRRAGIDAELQQLLSPADLYSISSAAAADQIAQQGMGVAMQAMAGAPQL